MKAQRWKDYIFQEHKEDPCGWSTQEQGREVDKNQDMYNLNNHEFALYLGCKGEALKYFKWGTGKSDFCFGKIVAKQQQMDLTKEQEITVI